MRSAETVSESRRISGASWLSSTNAAAVSFRPQRCIITSYVLVVAATAIARLPGLNPASLWWDDLWVATLAKASLREAIVTPATTPPGFLLILWLFRRLIPDPEWSLQLFPFLCGLVVVPLTGVAVSRITESSLLGLAAAATVALNPLLATYSVFVKQYTLDASTTAAWLLAALAALDRPSPTMLCAVAGFGLLGFFFSFNSILASFLLVHLVCFFAVIDARPNLGALGARLLPVVVFDLVLLVWFELDVSYRQNQALDDYWRSHFMSTASTGRAIAFLKTKGWATLQQSLPQPIGGFALLAFPGFAAIAMRRPRLGVFLALYLLDILVLSRLHCVPLGARTAAFTVPVFVLLTFAAIDLAPRSMPGRKALHGALAAGAIAFAIWNPFRSRYFAVDDAFTVERLAKTADKDDAVLVYPWASWLVAYYSDWPYELKRSINWTCNFQPHFVRPNTLVLKIRKDRFSRQLADLLDDQQFSTVFYAETRENPQLPRSDIFADLDRRGYEGRLLIRSRKSVLYAFRRKSP